MIIIDTNVISELMRPTPDPAVLRWFDAQPARDLHLTAVTVAELLLGVARLDPGARRDGLAAAVGALVDEDFAERILPFDHVAAVEYASVVARRARLGRPVSMADAQIAAIARAHGAGVVTRNVSDFQETGVSVIDPFV